MTGRVSIVTGAEAGVGFEVAKSLCEAGNEVILACKDEAQTSAAVGKIKEHVPDALAAFMQLDLLSTESIRKFVDEFHASGKKLHLLVNCHGFKPSSSSTQPCLSADNFELTMAANHLGHFLLTNLLLTDLKNAAADGGDARVVVVTSSLHDATAKSCRSLQPLDFDNFFLFSEKAYSAAQAYKNSRAANLLFSYELARRMQDSGVKVYAICPGVEPTTEMMTNGNGVHRLFSRIFARCVTAPVSLPQAANAVCSLCTDDKYKDLSGKYIKDGEEMQSSEETRTEEAQAKLWELSARLVRLEGYEPLEVTPPAPQEPSGKDKVKKEKKAKKGKSAVTDKPDENAVVENEHAAENGKTEKCDEGKENKDSEEKKEEQELTGDKIEEEAKNVESVIADKKQETLCNNGDCKTAVEDSDTPAAESDKQEVQKVEINGGDDCNTASE